PSPPAQSGSALTACKYHVDVTTLVVRGGRACGMHETGGLVQGDRGGEFAVALEKELAGSAREILRDDGLHEPAADAEPLMAAGDGHLRELETIIARVEQSARADDRSAMTGQEDRAALAENRERLGEHLLVYRLHAEILLQPLQVEPFEIPGVAALERNDFHGGGFEAGADPGREAASLERPVDGREVLGEWVVRFQVGRCGDDGLPDRLQTGHDTAAAGGERQEPAPVVLGVGQLPHDTMAQELAAHLTHRGMRLTELLGQLRDAEPPVVAQQEEDREAAGRQVHPGAAVDLIDAGVESFAHLAQARAEKKRA